MTDAASSLVADASAIIDYLLRQPSADRIARAIFADGVRVHAPELIDSELLQVLRRLELSATLGAWEAQQLRGFARELPLELHPLRPHCDRVWSIRHCITVTDAYYVSLAEALEAPLLTTDKRLARTVATMESVRVIDLDD
ncbi:MAG: type II toxin-antitoxin system VapC family toxin [Sciscionella sp.]